MTRPRAIFTVTVPTVPKANGNGKRCLFINNLYSLSNVPGYLYYVERSIWER